MAAKQAKASQHTSRKLSQEKILEAAAKLVRQDGLEELSMRRLAQELDVKAPAIYWHFRKKDELIGALLRYLSTQFVLPEVSGEDWRQRCEALCEQAREMARTQPELLTLEYYGGLMSPLSLQLSAALVDIFLEEGLEAEKVIHASQYLVLTLMSLLRTETNLDRQLPPLETMAQIRLGKLAEETEQSRRQHAELIGRYALFSPDKFFHYSLQHTLDSIGLDIKAARLNPQASVE